MHVVVSHFAAAVRAMTGRHEDLAARPREFEQVSRPPRPCGQRIAGTADRPVRDDGGEYPTGVDRTACGMRFSDLQTDVLSSPQKTAAGRCARVGAVAAAAATRKNQPPP